MNKSAFDELWHARLQDMATKMQKDSGAGAVMIAIFDGPWMDGSDPAIIGLAGAGSCDPFRLARDLRGTADVLEKSAGDIVARKPFEREEPRKKPVRD